MTIRQCSTESKWRDKIRGVVKYLVQWKKFTVEHDTLKREEDLKNKKEVVAEFKGKMNGKVRQQEKWIWQKKETLEGENCQENIWQRCCIDGMMKSLRRSI